MQIQSREAERAERLAFHAFREDLELLLLSAALLQMGLPVDSMMM